MNKKEADMIWEKHKEQYPDYAVIPKDSSVFWKFLSSLVEAEKPRTILLQNMWEIPKPLVSEDATDKEIAKRLYEEWQQTVVYTLDLKEGQLFQDWLEKDQS